MGAGRSRLSGEGGPQVPPLAGDARVWSLLAANLFAVLIAQDEGIAIPSLVVLFWLQANVGIVFGVVAMVSRSDVPLSFRLGILAPFLIFAGLQAWVAQSLPAEPEYLPLAQAWAAFDAPAIAFIVTVFAVDGFAALRSMPPPAASVLSPTQTGLLIRAITPALEQLVLPLWLLAFNFFVGLGFVAEGAASTSALWAFAGIKTFVDINIHRRILHSRRIAGVDADSTKRPR